MKMLFPLIWLVMLGPNNTQVDPSISAVIRAAHGLQFKPPQSISLSPLLRSPSSQLGKSDMAVSIGLHAPITSDKNNKMAKWILMPVD